MQSTLHATRRTPDGASRLVQAMSAWLAKTRRAPCRHSRDARVYGHTITGMHKQSTPAPSTPPPHATAYLIRVLPAHLDFVVVVFQHSRCQLLLESSILPLEALNQLPPLLRFLLLNHLAVEPLSVEVVLHHAKSLLQGPVMAGDVEGEWGGQWNKLKKKVGKKLHNRKKTK